MLDELLCIIHWMAVILLERHCYKARPVAGAEILINLRYG